MPDNIYKAIPLEESPDIFKIPMDWVPLQEAEESVKTLCYTGLAEKYGTEPGSIITDRLDDELDKLSHSGYWNYILLAYKLVKKCDDLGYPHRARATVGNSFICYLLGITEVNPLPPHYYCPTCKSVEWVEDSASGFDMADTICGKCGQKIYGNGHNLPCEFFYGFDGDKQINIEIDIARECRPYLVEYLNELSGDEIFDDDKPPVIYGEARRNTVSLINISSLSELKEYHDRSGIMFKDVDIKSVDPKKYFDIYRTGNHNEDYTVIIDKLLEGEYINKFSDIVKATGLMHSTGTWNHNAENLLAEGHDLSDVIGFREDVMQMFLKHGIERKDAYELAEYVRMGKAYSNGFTEEQLTLINGYGIPDWYIDSMRKAAYLFPRAHMIDIILSNLRRIWYWENCSE